MSYVIVANTEAGSSERVEASATLLSAAGGCEIVWTERSADLDTVVSGDDRTLVVAGGNGSIHLLVDRLARAGRLDRPVGILPMGTGNDLARGLGLPLDPEAARRGSDWKDGLGALAYPAGSLVEGLRFEGIELTVEADGRRFHRGRGVLVMVLVGPSAGGGFRPLSMWTSRSEFSTSW